MSDLESSFALLLGKQPDDAAKQRLYRVRDALSLRDNDALWLMIMALEHYETLYEEIPQNIQKVAGATLSKLKEAAESSVKASAEATKKDLAEAVARASVEVAHSTSRKQARMWLGIGLGIATIALISVGWVAFEKGKEAGLAQGYAEAKDEKLAAVWAGTVEGKLAYKLAKADEGNIGALAGCTRPGWVKQKGVCYAEKSEDGLYGWKVP